MTELIKSIVMTILGIATLVIGIVLKAGLEVYVVGGLLTVCGIIWIILDVIKNNKKNCTCKCNK